MSVSDSQSLSLPSSTYKTRRSKNKDDDCDSLRVVDDGKIVAKDVTVLQRILMEDEHVSIEENKDEDSEESVRDLRDGGAGKRASAAKMSRWTNRRVSAMGKLKALARINSETEEMGMIVDRWRESVIHFSQMNYTFRALSEHFQSIAVRNRAEPDVVFFTTV